MREKLVSWGQVAALLAAAFCLAAANDAKKERNCIGGEAESVKGWGAKDFLAAKTEGKPMCVYIHDPKYNHNMAAKYFEGKDVLDNAEVKEQLRGFLCVRLKSDGSDSKGWPGDWLGRGFDGAVLVLATSDFAEKFIYDKQNKGEIGAAGMVARLKALAKYEEERKVLVARTKLVPGPQSTPPPPPPPAVAGGKAEKPPPPPPSFLDDEKKKDKKPEKKRTVDGPTDE
jgi:hypothetical protein